MSAPHPSQIDPYAYAFSLHFSEDELAQLEELARKLDVLTERGLVSRKLEKWAYVMHVRQKQLALTPGVGGSARAEAKIKSAYLHAHAKAEHEADKLLSQYGLTLTPPEVVSSASSPLEADPFGDELLASYVAVYEDSAGDIQEGVIFASSLEAAREQAQAALEEGERLLEVRPNISFE